MLNLKYGQEVKVISGFYEGGNGIVIDFDLLKERYLVKYKKEIRPCFYASENVYINADDLEALRIN